MSEENKNMEVGPEEIQDLLAMVDIDVSVINRYAPKLYMQKKFADSDGVFPEYDVIDHDTKGKVYVRYKSLLSSVVKDLKAAIESLNQYLDDNPHDLSNSCEIHDAIIFGSDCVKRYERCMDFFRRHSKKDGDNNEQ